MNLTASNKTSNLEKTTAEGYNLKEELKHYTKNWKWFLFSCFCFLVLAFIYIRYATPEYNATAQIMLLSDDNSNSPASAILNDLTSFSAIENKKIEDEIELLKSRKLMSGVVKQLSLNITYSKQGRISNTPIFPNSEAPININFIASDSIIDNAKFSLTIEIISETSFNYKINEVGVENEFIKMDFGRNLSTPIGDIIITPKVGEDLSNKTGQFTTIDINPVAKVADIYKTKILVEQAGELSRVLNISLDDVVAEKARAIINTLISEYNRTSIKEKNERTKNTADFIDERVNLIAADLAQADNKVEQFKTGNRLTNIASEADLYVQSSAATDRELAEAQSQLNQINYMKDNVDDVNASSFEFIPSNVGMSDGTINNLTEKYNDLLRQRNSLLSGSSKDKNPIILNLNQELISLKQSLNQSLDNSVNSLSLEINSLQNQSSKLNSKIYSVPGQARKSRDIEREQGTKESLYLYLLQKREEVTISLTSTSPSAKIIDYAYSASPEPVIPNKKIVYLASIIIGLCIPFSIIYVRDLLDDKIHNKEDLDKVLKNISVIGEIPKLNNKNSKLLIKRNDRSLLSESFRIIRTNLDYVQKGRNVKDYNNVIFVTSTINGEGKSFFSMNMALTLVNSDKRVLLIGADIRNPKIYPALKNQVKNNKTTIGLTEYLTDKALLVGEAINTYEINNNKIDILLTGKIPPNPAELLMSDRMKLLFDKVSSQYDYVIVDTAPAMLVTDTLLFSEYAGHTIFMTRAGYTEKRILNFAKELHDENRLKGMMLVVNDVKQANFGYGARYGYNSTPEKTSFLKRIFT